MTAPDLRRSEAPFEVVSEYTPSGDQPKAIDELAERVRAGERDVVLLGASEAFETACRDAGHKTSRVRERLVVEVEGRARLDQLLQKALEAGANIAEVTPRHETLEDLFVREAIESDGARSADAGSDAEEQGEPVQDEP